MRYDRTARADHNAHRRCIMADNTTTTTTLRELLHKAHGAQCKTIETLTFLRRCLDQGLALDEAEIDGLNNVLGNIQSQLDEALDATDKAVTLLQA